MELLSLIRRKSRNSSSDSNSNSPEFKRKREEQELEDLHESLDILTIPEDAKAEQSFIVLTALHMAQNFASKAAILAKLTQLDAITLPITLLQNSVDKTECYRKCLGKWGCNDQERFKNCFQPDEWTEEQWK